jgi:hypothetical protein
MAVRIVRHSKRMEASVLCDLAGAEHGDAEEYRSVEEALQDRLGLFALQHLICGRSRP